MLSKHVDDLKIAGQKHHVERLIKHIENVFGKMKGTTMTSRIVEFISPAAPMAQ